MQPQPETHLEETLDQHNYDINEFQQQPQPQTAFQHNQAILDNRIQQKKNYLKHLKQISKQSSVQIRKLNEEIDKKMAKLLQKQVAKKKQPRGPCDPELEKKLNEKYKELDLTRKQIKKIKAKEFSVQFAVDRVKELKGQMKVESSEVEKLGRILESLKKANSNEEDSSNGNVLVPTYLDEISKLKQKIKQITTQRQIQTQQLLSLPRKPQNKSLHMPSIQQRSKSTTKVVIDQTIQQLTKQVAQYKRKYEDIGRRIQIMRVRRNILLQEDSHLQDRVRLLNSYKGKYEEMRKVVVAEARRGRERREEEEAKREKEREKGKEEEEGKESKEETIEENIYASVKEETQKKEMEEEPTKLPKLSNQQYVIEPTVKQKQNFIIQQDIEQGPFG